MLSLWEPPPVRAYPIREQRSLMRAAVLNKAGATPEVVDFPDPSATDGYELVDVAVAGLNPVDLKLASGHMGAPAVPAVVGLEGVGTLSDGRRVYFSGPPAPYGSWAPHSLADPAEVFPVPEDLDDALAVAMGIAGLAAWIPLSWHARIRAGEHVLVLGATGVVGQIAVQAARILGAGRIVGAGRSHEALRRIERLGAHATVVLGDGEDAHALAVEAGEDGGYDVVIDMLYGEPFVAALKASAPHARLVSVGLSAGDSARVGFRDLQGRTHIGHANQMAPREVRCDAYAQLTRHAAAGSIELEIERFALEDAPRAWRAQGEGPHHKIVLVP
jgi:NADPH:quinone reductase-like Zn-dependent oxidoreductase